MGVVASPCHGAVTIMGCNRAMTSLARLLRLVPRVMRLRGRGTGAKRERGVGWGGWTTLLVSLSLHLGIVGLFMLLPTLFGEGAADQLGRGAISVEIVSAVDSTLASGSEQKAAGPAGADRSSAHDDVQPESRVADSDVDGTEPMEASPPTGGGDSGGGTPASVGAADGGQQMAGSADYGRRLLEHMRAYRRYPDNMGSAPVGLARVGMRIDQAGNVVEVWLQTSSGHPILDREAVDTVVRADPMPPPPTGWASETTIVLPIDFMRRDIAGRR